MKHRARRWKVASLLAAFATAVLLSLWVVSYFVGPWVRVSTRYTSIGGGPALGSMILALNSDPSGGWDPGITWGTGKPRDMVPTPSNLRKFMGFGYISMPLNLSFNVSTPTTPTLQIRILFVPMWAPTLVCAMATFFAARRWRQRRRMEASNRCAACGYDLRATPTRCPECGATPER